MIGGITANRNKLIESMESFLCSFAYSIPDMSEMGMGMSSGMGMERVTPFLMYTQTLGSKVRHSDNEEVTAEEWTIADLIISGALDRSSSALGMEREPNKQRAWIASANDFVFVPASRPTSIIAVPEPSASSISKERRRTSDGSEGSGGHGGLLTPPESVSVNHGGLSVTPPLPVFQRQSSSSWSGELLHREEPILAGVRMEGKVLPLTLSDSGSDSSAASVGQGQPGNGAKKRTVAIPKFGGGGVSKDKNLQTKVWGRWRFWKGTVASTAST